MDDTWFYLPEEKADRLVDVWHTPDFDSGELEGLTDDSYPVSGAKTLFMGGAGLSGTAKDYFLFCDAMRRGGQKNGERILKEETVRLMIQNQIDTLSVADGLKFGYGFAVHEIAEDWQRSPGSYDWGGFWQTTFWIDPDRDIIAILCSNAIYGNGGKYEPRFEEIINHALSMEETGAMDN